MKKTILLISLCLITACAQNHHQKRTCPSIFDGWRKINSQQTCDHAYKTQDPYAPKYREQIRPQYTRQLRTTPQVVYVYKDTSCNSCGCNNCTKQNNVTQTKEPVEIVYKKTTYTTSCNPQTTQTVTYEKEPYSATKENVVLQPSTQETKDVVTTTLQPVQVAPAQTTDPVLLTVEQAEQIAQ